MNPFIGELIGTALLVLLGNGVVANVVLAGAKGNNAGWIVTTWGWGMATFVAVFTVAAFSGAHINPARDLAPRIAEPQEPETWLARPGAPKPKLDDEAGQGRTIDYDALIRSWREGKPEKLL